MQYALHLIGLAAIFAAGLWWSWRDYKAKHADQPLFLTHTPDGLPVGSVRDGYRITRLERVAPTALASGGVAPCWQVHGHAGDRYGAMTPNVQGNRPLPAQGETE